MNNILDFDLGSDITESMMYSSIIEEFFEDVNSLNQLTYHDIFTEKVVNHNDAFGRRVKDSLASGGKFAASTAGTYFNVVDAGGNLLKNTWDLIMRAINLMSRIIKFITNKIADIPRFIGRVATKVGRIGPNLRDKIKGNLSIYISASDIGMLYQRDLFNMVSDFLKLAETLSRGDIWGRWLKRNRRKDEETGTRVNDRKICREMDKIYFKLKLVDFKQTTIEINNDSSRELYFGNSKSISFKDLEGKQHRCTYYEALGIIIKDIKLQQDKLKAIDESLIKKLDITKGNQAFSNLDFVTQRLINDTIGMVSKVVGILGSITKCVIADMKFIDESTNKIIKAQNKKFINNINNNPAKDAARAAAAANKIPNKKRKNK